MKTTKRVLPVLIGLGAIGGCDDKPKRVDTPALEAGTVKPPVILRKGDPMPIQMGGAAAPAPRPTAATSGGAPGAAAAAAPAPVAAVQIVHDHPADQPCHPLTKQEVQKALDDLR